MKTYSLLALLVSLSISPCLFARVWTDRQGRQTEAQFIRVRGDNVVLQKGMKPLVIPLKEFCDEDQEYIKEQTKSKGGTKPAANSDKESAESPPPSSAKKNAKSDDDDSNPFLTDTEKSPGGKSPRSPARKDPKSDDDDSNPFLSDAEKSPTKDSHSDGKKPVAEKPEKPDAPKINTDGGFDPRGWTDVKGNKLTASFVRLEGKMVVLSKDGEERQFPIDQFCYNDKLYIRQAALDRKKYEKFAGNRENAVANATPPHQASGAPAGGMWGHSSAGNMGPGVNAAQQMLAQQQAEAQRRAQEATARAEQNLRDMMARNTQSSQPLGPPPIVTRPASPPPPPVRFSDPSNAAPMPPVPISSPVTDFSPPVKTKICMNCNKPVPDSAKAGGTCPHCGVVWDYEQDEHGKTIGWSPAKRAGGIGGLVVAASAVISMLFRWLRRRE